MQARLELEDGTVYEGRAFGSQGSAAGEVVFTTGMVGYPESLTDPSYAGQILCFTYPLIGNYGVNDAKTDSFGLPERFESDTIHARGAILNVDPEEGSHWNAAKSFDEWLRERDIPCIAGIDTRALTKKLRENGVMLGRIIVGNDIPELTDPNAENLVAQVSPSAKELLGEGDLTICVVDCGCKHSIIREFLKRKVKVLRVPWDYDFTKEHFDGLFLSNGPGDPTRCTATIAHINATIGKKPIFGICLGNQLLALAAGATTYKLPYGHRSHNQPCVDKETGRCYITSQNHGFAVDATTLPDDFEEWFVNANDGSNEGIKHRTLPIFSFQAHPEARGGPEDATWMFDRFLELVRRHRRD